MWLSEIAIVEIDVKEGDEHKVMSHGRNRSRRPQIGRGDDDVCHPLDKKHNAHFRFAERCLYEFKENEARLHILKNDLETLKDSSSAKAQTYEAFYGNGMPSDNVAARLERIEKVSDIISRLERKVIPIQRLIADLRAPYVLDDSPKAELYKILQLYYFGNNIPKTVTKALDIPKSSFYRKREELVRSAIRYLGL